MAFGAKIQITADRSSAGKSAFNQSIKDLARDSKAEVKISALDLSQDVINKAFESKQAVLTVKRINMDAAIADVQKKLSEMLSHLSVSNGISISGLVDYAGGDNMAKQAEKNAAAYEKEAAALETSAKKKREAAQASAEYKAELKALEPLIQNARQAYKSETSSSSKTRIGDETVVSQLADQWKALTQAFENYKAARTQDDTAATDIAERAKAIIELVTSTQEATEANDAYLASLKAMEPAISNARSAYKQATGSNPQKAITDEDTLALLTEQWERLTDAVEQYKSQKVDDPIAKEAILEQASAITKLVTETQAATRAEAEQEKQIEQNIAAKKREEAQNASLSKSIVSQYNAVTKYINDNPKAMQKTGYATSLTEIQKKLLDAKNGLTTLDRTQLNNLAAQFKNVQGQINEANAAGQTFVGMVQKLYGKFGGWYLISQSFTLMVRALKQMVVKVKELDAAMTELRKVTAATEAAYDAFFESATERASKVGATLTDTITASADFARLGYSMSEAAELADAALIYKNVGDGITDVSTASEYLISTMKAFGVEATDVMSIVDKFNQVGNEYAISSSGLGEALQRSASALASAGNTLEESIGLAVGMNNVLQNPEKVGTALSTASMYLRAAKTEAEEAGESTDGMANSVSELRDELLRLSGVDVMLNANEFKSTFQIYKELAEVWEDIADVDQANILELIGGKRNANANAALLTNFEQAESAMKSAMNSSGSALAENEKYLDSINGKLSQLSATFESLSAHIVNSDIVKIALDVANWIMKGVDGLARANALLPILIAGFGVIKSVVGPEGGSAATTSILMATWNEQAA